MQIINKESFFTQAVREADGGGLKRKRANEGTYARHATVFIITQCYSSECVTCAQTHILTDIAPLDPTPTLALIVCFQSSTTQRLPRTASKCRMLEIFTLEWMGINVNVWSSFKPLSRTTAMQFTFQRRGYTESMHNYVFDLADYKKWTKQVLRSQDGSNPIVLSLAGKPTSI